MYSGGASVAKPGPKLIYKLALPSVSRQMNSLSQPILLQTSSGLTGFKSMGFVAGSSGTAFGFDFDTSQVLWKTPLGAGVRRESDQPAWWFGSASCAATWRWGRRFRVESWRSNWA